MTIPTDPELLKHIVDVHCHPTDSRIDPDANLDITICAMSTQPSDQILVRQLATSRPNVIPCFGYHPWFSHWVAVKPFTSKEEHYRRLFGVSEATADSREAAFVRILESLPEPYMLQDLTSELRSNLAAFPNALLGEVGLDRSMRVPYDHKAVPGERKLSPFKVPIDHQLRVLEAQVAVAMDLKRCISLHSVSCQAITAEFIDRMRDLYGEKWLAVSIDLHSCNLSVESWLAIERKHCNIYCSLSTVVNERTPAHLSLIAACAEERLLAESDFHDISHCASRTWDMIKVIAGVKNWPVESKWDDDDADMAHGVVRRLAKNWDDFVNARHMCTKPLSKRGRNRSELIASSDEEE